MFLKIINTNIIRTKINKYILLLLVLGCSSFSLQAQTVVKGFVRDAITKKPMPFVSVVFKDGKGVSTGDDGSYSIETKNPKFNTLIFSYVGYITVSKKIATGTEQTLNIDLEMSSSLKEIVVKKGRGKYRNKNNPAVELIDKVIENKEKNRITAYDYVQYQQYEKLALALANKPEKLMKNRLFKNYKFMMENIDSTTLGDGRSMLPIYIEERLTNNYYRKDPLEQKTYILGEKKVDYGEFLDNAGISSYLNSLYADINIYDNDIALLNQRFLSPIADIGPSFYRYYIIDTTELEGIKLIRLNFTPRNPNDLIFRGTMFITLDGNYSIQKIDMTISKKANVNWTKELKIKQDFEKGPDGRYHVIMSDMLTEFALVNSSTGGMVGERLVSFKNFLINQPAPDSIYKGKDEVNQVTAEAATDSFWIKGRHTPLSSVQAKTYSNIDSLHNMRSFKTFMTVMTAIFTGYIVLGDYEIGNTNTFYSFNPVEGFRLRVGGRSTPKWSNRFYTEEYIAYGFTDKQYKYSVSGTYSLNGKSIYSYPLHYLKVGYQYDMKIPGQELQFVQEDNFLLSFKRGKNDKWFYTKTFRIDYTKEFGKNLSYTFGFKNINEVPAGAITFQKGSPDNETVYDLTSTELSAEIRWAPNEQFYQGKNFRIPIINKYPTFRFRYIQGIKGPFGGEYNYTNLNLISEKRCYMSQLGYTDVTLEGGYIFGQVPFPLLTVHRANQTYGYQLNSYNLMNFLEFVSDKYAAANFDVHFNGFFLNKIPLLRKFKLREVASAKILYGSLRDENNPDTNPELYKFPTDPITNKTTTFTLDNGPYVEVSIGLANIFKLLRVDLVRRVTYLDHPDVTAWGVRVKVKFEF